ncbi:MAG: GNAT family N-acetyltransferase [Candidatus Berkelbacteria bacterium]
MEVKIFRKGEIEDIVEIGVDLLTRMGFSDAERSRKAILNSSRVGIVYDGENPVGIGRVISDETQSSFIVDVNILKDNRRKGFGRALVVELAKSCNSRNIMLTTDPRDQGLTDFYKKIGFEFCEGEHVFKWQKK